VIALNRNNRLWKQVAVVISLAGFFYSAHAADGRAEEIVSKHLDSIGTAAARTSVKSLAVQGTLRFKILTGGAGEAVGSWGRVSEQRKSNFVMRFGNGDWRGEQFIFDGDRTSFAAATSQHLYSSFAKFVSAHDFIVKEGLLGGELSTAWALENLDQGRSKLNYVGRKKIDGHELEGIEYVNKGGDDMTVKLYFDPETYRHVLTIYSVDVAPIGAQHGITTSARQDELRYTLEERFSEFQAADGLTLPRRYTLQYTEQLQDGSTHVYDWDMTADKIHDNLDLDPGNFRLR
jgi:hypothetical protein